MTTDLKFPPLSESAQAALERKRKMQGPVAIVNAPPDIDAAFQEALNLHRAGRLAESEARFRAILAESPDEPEILKKFAAVLAAQWKWEESLEACRLALAYVPIDGAAWCQAGAALGFLGRHAEAEEAFHRACQMSPELPAAEWNRSLALIQRGKWREGWRGTQWGRVTGARRTRTLSEEWELGDPFQEAGVLFVWAEQGIGDTIQMLQLLPMLKKMSGAQKIILEIPEELIGLVHGQTCADIVHKTTEDGHIPFAFDAHVSLMSLPGALNLRPGDLPGKPYLNADAGKRQPGKSGFRVGVCARGNPHHGNDRARSLDEQSELKLVKTIPGKSFSCLEKDNATLRDWTDTAALIADLDLILTVDTAVAHLAGALGKPVWMLHSVSGDFRWGLESEATPWYPTMRIFRQTRYMDWSDVIARIGEELGKLPA